MKENTIVYQLKKLAEILNSIKMAEEETEQTTEEAEEVETEKEAESEDASDEE